MTENLYPEFHVEKLKNIVGGWALKRPEIEKICLFRGLEDVEGYKYWIVIVAPSEEPSEVPELPEDPELMKLPEQAEGEDRNPPELPKEPKLLARAPSEEGDGALYIAKPEVDEAKDDDDFGWFITKLTINLMNVGHSSQSDARDLAACFTKTRFITDSWFLFRISPEEYTDGKWVYDENEYVWGDANDSPLPKEYFVNPGSELVLFERENISEGKLSQIAAENLSARGKVIQYAKWMYENGNPLSAKDFKPGANEIISTIAKNQNVAPDTLRKYVTDTVFYLKSNRGRPPKN